LGPALLFEYSGHIPLLGLLIQLASGPDFEERRKRKKIEVLSCLVVFVV
jgi:hypothetical protein